MQQIIDPHLHLFNLADGQYTWLKPQNPPFWPAKQDIHRSFVEADLSLSSQLNLAGFVHVEAGFDNLQPWREIDWLEQHCTLPFKSVAFADLTASTFNQHVQQLAQRQSVVGIRHILDEQATTLLSLPVIPEYFAQLDRFGLSFDAQLALTDRPAISLLADLARQHPRVKIILNHGGQLIGSMTTSEQSHWQQNLQTLALLPNIAIKLSGWEMADRHWQVEHASIVLQECVACFGDERVMLASNFPLCLFSTSYANLWDNYMTLANLSNHSVLNITCNNAKDWYQFKPVIPTPSL